MCLQIFEDKVEIFLHNTYRPRLSVIIDQVLRVNVQGQLICKWIPFSFFSIDLGAFCQIWSCQIKFQNSWAYLRALCKFKHLITFVIATQLCSLINLLCCPVHRCPPSFQGAHIQDLSPLTWSPENPGLSSTPLIYIPRVALAAVVVSGQESPNGIWFMCSLISPPSSSLLLSPPPNSELPLLLAYSLIIVIIAVENVNDLLSNDTRGKLMSHVC
jgi:hypothetical protein